MLTEAVPPEAVTVIVYTVLALQEEAVPLITQPEEILNPAGSEGLTEQPVTVPVNVGLIGEIALPAKKL